MITRKKVIRNAEQYLNIQPWQPLSDEHIFNAAKREHTFYSAYTMGEDDPVAKVCRYREYDVVPYVYGGFDTRVAFWGRINNRNCPGGWDRVTGRGTKYWYDRPPQGFGYGERVPGNLAGIDCSGYVSRCWGFTQKYSTSTLPNICLRINRRNLQKGDILNRRGNHVRIFDSWAGTSRVKIYEAVGGGRTRPFNTGDEFGRVVCHAIDWDDRYIPHSPFPQFEDMNPAPGSYISPNAALTISVQCRGSGDVEILYFCFNEQSVNFTQVRRGKIVEANYSPNFYDLSPGRYKIDVIAINRVGGQSFQDEFSWEFDLL